MPPINYKHELIIEKVKGKRVLHIGATNAPYHVENAKVGKLLHQKIKGSCKSIIGIDYDRVAIEELKKYGVNDIHFGDIIKGQYDERIPGNDYDIILFADVIEHLDNPGLALENVRSLCNPSTLVIITTPNAWSIVHILNHFKREEYVHPDHKFWPSKATMDALLGSCGFEVVSFQYCLTPSEPKKKTIKGRIFKRLVLDKFPHTGHTLFYELKVSGGRNLKIGARIN